MTHATKGDPVHTSTSAGVAETMCGREYTGTVATVSGPEGVTCPTCQARLMAELAAELAEVHAQMTTYGEPTVLSTPEAVTEPTVSRERYMTPGRKRHGRIIHDRAEKRRAMKEAVANVR